MKGTIINAIAIILGSSIGIFFSKLIPEKIKDIIFQALGLSTILIGLQMAFKTGNLLILIFSLLIGGIIGEALDLEKRLNSFGEFLRKKMKSKNRTFVEGFVTASLVFCIGAMAIVGSIQDGINDDQTVLYTKSLLDGFASIAFSSALGIGVVFSVIPILLYQGGMTLLAVYLKDFLTSAVITEMTAAGGMLIFGIGLNILKIKVIKVGNLLPSVLVAVMLALMIM
ncbi:MAG: DUF554 domain-containing protein [Candidatus Woesearchaeota archaeon]|nr:DUF554 domain-containing protein [Candidatus Woesearchaeota archaeon]